MLSTITKKLVDCGTFYLQIYIIGVRLLPWVFRNQLGFVKHLPNIQDQEKCSDMNFHS